MGIEERRSLRKVALLACVAALMACGGAARAPVGVDDGHRSPVIQKPKPPDPPVSGHIVASVGQRTIGPFLARRGSGPDAAGLVAWVTAAEGSGRRVLVVPVSGRGAPRGPETVAAHVSVDTTLLVVRPMRGPAPGFVIAWTSLTDRGKSLWTVAVGDDGAPRAKPVELTRTTDDIVWVDIVPTDHGAVCLWAEETRGNDANLVAASLNTDGGVRGAPTRVATGIVGWHALELPSGVGVSTVLPVSNAKPKAPTGLLRDARPGGSLFFHHLDADGHVTGQPVVVTAAPIVSGDVEVVRDGSRLVFAWTNRTADEPAISMAAIEDTRVVEPPRTVAEARGGASLLALTAGEAGTAVMFEAPTRRRGENRRVHVAKVDAKLRLGGKPLSLEVIGRGQPELAATSTGFAVLATIPDCEPDSPACISASAVATVLRTDANMTVLQREPLTFVSDPATLGWSMTCDADTCLALAASPGPPGAPSRIRTAAVNPRVNTSPAETKPEGPKEAPRIVDITAVTSGETVVDIATARIGDSTLLAMLSTKGDVNKGEAKTATTTLTTRVVGDGGGASAPNLITARALPIGGVAIAGADKPEDGGAVAWIARASGDPEVHIARIDARGKRTQDLLLTTVKGDASDVTLTWVGDGWIVAWVDFRDGNGEVYATKVSPELKRLARDERITTAPGDASDLVAIARGSQVWLAWADPRESPREGVSDIYVCAVRTRDAKRAIDEQRLLPTAAHSRTPHLLADPEGVTIAWIEEAPLGSETPNTSGYGAFWARFDASGKPVAKPSRIPLAGEGAATSVAIEPAPNGGAAPRAVVARSMANAVAIDGIDLSVSPPKTSALLALDGPPSLDVALVLDGGILYFNDEGPRPVDRRARRARIAWTDP